ncbi:DUF4411 family protein [Salmonella enterica]|nr:DUF4411 family protein [Salmonella enterica]
MIYLLDANSFIQAKNFHYRMNVVPGFWEWLIKKHGKIDICSIDRVYDELTKNKNNPDLLHKWSVENKSFFRESTDTDIQKEFVKIAGFIYSNEHYSVHEVDRFLGGADPWLIAYAKKFSATIVTHEVMVPENSKKVKIPNIAKKFGVDYTEIYELLELTKANLVLKHC